MGEGSVLEMLWWGLLVVWNVHAAEVAAGISAVHDMAVGEDVGESTFLAELAVSLFGQSVTIHRLLQLSHLCEILAGHV